MSCGVPSRAVDDDDGMRSRCDMQADLLQVAVHGFGADAGGDDGGTQVAGGADGTKDVGGLVSLIAPHPWPCAALGPDTGQGSFLADPRLVLEPELDWLALGVLGKDSFDQDHEVFLKFSWASAFAL